MAIVHGRHLIVHKEGMAIAAAKSCTLSSSCELIEISSPNTGTYREYIAGRKEWSVRLSRLVLENQTFEETMDVGTRYDISMLVPNRDDFSFSYFAVVGSAILTKCEIAATVGNLAQGVIEFKGSGVLRSVRNIFPSLMEGWEDETGNPADVVYQYQLESASGADLFCPPTRYPGGSTMVYSCDNDDAPNSIKVYRSQTYQSIASIISTVSPTIIQKTGTAVFDGVSRPYYIIPSGNVNYKYIVINVGPYANYCQLETSSASTAFVGI